MSDDAGHVAVAPARAEDLGDLVALAQAHRAYYAAYGPLEPLDPATLRARIHRALFESAPAARALIARLEGQAVGALYYSLLFPNIDYRPGLFVKDLFVCEAFRRRGVGRALVRGAAEIARALRADRVELHVVGPNAPARRLYETEGFDVMERLVLRLEPS